MRRGTFLGVAGLNWGTLADVDAASGRTLFCITTMGPFGFRTAGTGARRAISFVARDLSWIWGSGGGEER